MTRTLTTLILAIVAFVGLSTPPARAAGAAGITTVSQLKNAPIPAYCRHKAVNLHGFERSFGPTRGEASLAIDDAVFAPLGPGGKKYAVVPLNCSAGGVAWPQLLLVYDRGPRLVGYTTLPGKQEHAYAGKLRVKGKTVRVAVTSYEGAGFGISTFKSTLTLHRGTVVMKNSPRLTVDFGDSGYAGPYTGGRYETYALSPAPKKLQAFVRGRLRPNDQRCVKSSIQLVRWSHRGYALAINDGNCEIATYELYRKKGARWAVLGRWSYSYGVSGAMCSDLTAAQRRGLTAVHGSCQLPAADPYQEVGTEKVLGTWPKDGQ